MDKEYNLAGTSSGSHGHLDESFPASLARLHPSDSGYGDSPGSTTLSALRFGYASSLPNMTSGGDQEVEEYDDVMELEDDEMLDDDDDVFLDSQDMYDGPGRHSPINIPINFRPSNSMAMATPPRLYTSNLGRFNDSPFMPGAVHSSPGGWSTDATRFNSPVDGLPSLPHPLRTAAAIDVNNAPSSSLPDGRPRFFSEGSALSGPGEAADEPPPMAPLSRRDRSRSEPAIQNELHQYFGRELRRISDEFHQSYSTLPETDGQASSYPGSNRRRRSSWWERVIQYVSPPALDTVVPSPDSSSQEYEDNDNDSSNSPHSSQSSATTVRTLQRQISELDTEGSTLDDVDGQFPVAQISESDIMFHIGDMAEGEDSSSEQ